LYFKFFEQNRLHVAHTCGPKQAKNQGMESVLFEFDCKLVVDAITSTSTPLNEYGYIISRCKT